MRNMELEPQESLLIGQNIVIKILSIQGNQIKLGLEAPKSISIFRNEIYKNLSNDYAPPLLPRRKTRP